MRACVCACVHVSVNLPACLSGGLAVVGWLVGCFISFFIICQSFICRLVNQAEIAEATEERNARILSEQACSNAIHRYAIPLPLLPPPS